MALIHTKLPMMPWLSCVLVVSLLPLELNRPIDGFLFTVRIAHLKAFAGPSVDPTNSLQTIFFVLVLEMHPRARPQPPWIGWGKFSGYRKLPITLTILLTLHDVMDFSLLIHRALWEAFLLFFCFCFSFAVLPDQASFTLRLSHSDFQFTPWGLVVSVEWSKVTQFREHTLLITLV